MRPHLIAAAGAGLLALAVARTPAVADEVFVGAAAHGVNTPFTIDTGERGLDLSLGWRSDPISGLSAIGSPSAHLFGIVNSAGKTDIVAAGLSWRLGHGPWFVRPGIGLALHDGPSLRVGTDGYRTDLGSRLLFEPEIGVGRSLSPNWSVEASWVHVSHARLFGGQNPGLDIIGLRLTRRLH